MCIRDSSSVSLRRGFSSASRLRIGFSSASSRLRVGFVPSRGRGVVVARVGDAAVFRAKDLEGFGVRARGVRGDARGALVPPRESFGGEVEAQPIERG